MAKLSEAEVVQQMARASGWQREGDEIRRQFTFGDFVGSMGFVNQVALLAEKADHHPDITINWNKVTLALSTHDEGGLTTKDFDLAEKFNALT